MNSRNQIQTDRIRECVVPITASNHQFVEGSFRFLGKRLLSEASHAHLIYLSGRRKQFVAGYLISKDSPEAQKLKIGYRNDFTKYLRKHHPKGLIDLAFLLTAYLSGVQEPRMRVFKPNRFLDQLWKDTGGYCVWKFQLETLIHFFEREEHLVCERRKLLNQGSPKAWAWFKCCKVPGSKHGLEKLVRERMILKLVVDPHSFQGARILYPYILKD